MTGHEIQPITHHASRFDGAQHGPITTAGPLALPEIDVSIRPARAEDLPFIDGLQKKQSKAVGWMPTASLEGKIAAGQVLLAEGKRHEGTEARSGDKAEGNSADGARAAWSLSPSSTTSCLRASVPSCLPLGYLIATDQYFKRDDVGIIYQINIAPAARRSLVAATLLRAQFERSAYGCRLYCCWCAQDLEANRFWEAMGFVPLAFRMGGRRKMRHAGTDLRSARPRRHGGVAQGEGNSEDAALDASVPSSPLRASVPSCLRASLPSASPRIHIFWQKRIRAGDVITPWWFPSKTAGGAIREDRIVLPIPPGVHWSAVSADFGWGMAEGGLEERKALPAARRAAVKKKAVAAPAAVRRNGLRFDIPRPGEPLPEVKPKKAAKAESQGKRVKHACDPQLVSAARELRDRWLEQVNADPSALGARGKYAVTRAELAAVERAEAGAVRLLAA